MAQNEPQRKETPPGPSLNSPSLLFEYQCRSGKLANRIESKLFLPESECSTVHNETTQPMKFGFQCMTLLLRHRIIHGNCMHGVHSLTNATHCVCVHMM